VIADLAKTAELLSSKFLY